MYECPYCHTISVPAPPDTPRPRALCGNCGAKPRAVISCTKDGTKLVRYVRDGRKASEPTQTVTVRLYRRQIEKYKNRNLSEVIRQALDKEAP